MRTTSYVRFLNLLLLAIEPTRRHRLGGHKLDRGSALVRTVSVVGELLPEEGAKQSRKRLEQAGVGETHEAIEELVKEREPHLTQR